MKKAKKVSVLDEEQILLKKGNAYSSKYFVFIFLHICYVDDSVEVELFLFHFYVVRLRLRKILICPYI